jgi:LacI family transcriptional regulator, galactose operon repressor
VNGPRSLPACADRAHGLKEAVRAAGLDPDRAVVEPIADGMSADEGESAVDALLAVSPRISAVFCANDAIAVGVLRGLGHRSLSVPEDLAIAGYDDVVMAAMLSPAVDLRQRVAQGLLV